MLADVLNMPIWVHKFDHTCALDAAMFAAVVSGINTNIETAMNAMGPGFDITYEPNEQLQSIYQKRYLQYQSLGGFIDKQGNKYAQQQQLWSQTGINKTK